MKRKDIKVFHKYDDLFSISCTGVHMVEIERRYYSGRRGWVIEGSGEYTEKTEDINYEPMRYTELVTLYVDLLNALNKVYGTSYEPIDAFVEQAKNYRGKPQAKYSNAYEDGWELKDSWEDKYEILHHYHYGDIPNCVATYGDWSKDELIALADKLVELFNADPYLMAKASLAKRWSLYDEIGIIYKKDENFA